MKCHTSLHHSFNVLSIHQSNDIHTFLEVLGPLWNKNLSCTKVENSKELKQLATQYKLLIFSNEENFRQGGNLEHILWKWIKKIITKIGKSCHAGTNSLY